MQKEFWEPSSQAAKAQRLSPKKSADSPGERQAAEEAVAPKIIIIILIGVGGLALFWKRPQPTTQDAPAYKTQQQESGDITLSVTPKVLSSKKPASFEIILDTHSVDLTFDMAGISNLEDINKTPYGKSVWEGDPPGGHHRKGTLTFSDRLKDSADVVTLTFSDIAGTDWKFQWPVAEKAWAL